MTGTTYAANTDVSSGRSRDGIEKTLLRYGATDFAYGWTISHAVIGFVISGRQVRFLLPLPDRNSSEFTLTPSRKWGDTPTGHYTGPLVRRLRGAAMPDSDFSVI
jgi:hypothetical protein